MLNLNFVILGDFMKDIPEGSYFVSAYPPFSQWQQALRGAYEVALDSSGKQRGDSPTGIYLHVPFCGKRCDFCYYLSYAGQSAQTIARYVEAVKEEIGMLAATTALKNQPISFIYIGGGTPSILKETDLISIGESLRNHFDCTSLKEFSFECAPKTVSDTKIDILKQIGVTRLSLGVQQYNDTILKANGRIHLVKDIDRAYASIIGKAFQVINIDLIVGMIGETEETFFQSLAAVTKMSPDTITIYQLEMPFNTPLYKAYKAGTLKQPMASWQIKQQRLKQAFAYLAQRGYTRTSAYMAVKNVNQENFLYQDLQYQGGNLIGLGAASFSYFNGVHHQNVASNDAYFEAIENNQFPLGRAYVLDDLQQAVRELILQFKLGKVNCEILYRKYGVNLIKLYRKQLDDLVETKRIAIENNIIIVSDDGMLEVDRIVHRFYLPQHQQTRSV